MATLFPASPPVYDGENSRATIKGLCNYSRQLQEYINFTIQQIQKDVDAIDERIKALDDKYSAVCEDLNARITALENNN